MNARLKLPHRHKAQNTPGQKPANMTEQSNMRTLTLPSGNTPSCTCVRKANVLPWTDPTRECPDGLPRTPDLSEWQHLMQSSHQTQAEKRTKAGKVQTWHAEGWGGKECTGQTHVRLMECTRMPDCIAEWPRVQHILQRSNTISRVDAAHRNPQQHTPARPWGVATQHADPHGSALTAHTAWKHTAHSAMHKPRDAAQNSKHSTQLPHGKSKEHGWECTVQTPTYPHYARGCQTA